jgi:Holliday junction resolvase
VAVAVAVKVKVKVKGGGAEGRKRALWCLLRGKGCEVLRFPSSCISWKQRASFFLLNRKMNARSAHVCLFHRIKKKKKKKNPMKLQRNPLFTCFLNHQTRICT